MAEEESVSARLASKGSASRAFVLPTDMALDLRKYAIEKALESVDTLDVLEVEDASEYGDIIIDIASKIEDFVLNGKKEETK